jgi:hypothetical protein
MTRSNKTHIIPLNKFLPKAIFILNTGISISYIILWFYAGKMDLFWRADFSMFYTGGTIVRENHGSRLYDYSLQSDTQQRILEGRSFAEGLLPFDYPPYVTLFFAPLTKIPLSTAYLIWVALQTVLLIWIIIILRRLMSGWTRQERWLAISAMFAFPPVFYNFLLGALSLLMMLSILQFYNGLKSFNNNKTALWFLVSTLKPTFMIFPGIALVASKRWKIIRSIVIGSAFVFLISTLFFGLQIWPDFINQILQISGHYGVYGFHPELMPNIRGSLSLLLGENQVKVINTVSVLALVAGTAVCFFLWKGKLEPLRTDFDLRMAATIMMIPLLSLHAYAQDSIVVVIAAFLVYQYIRANRIQYRIFIPLFLLYPFVVLVSDYVVADRLGIRIPVIAMILFTAWVFKVIAIENRRSDATHK